VDYGTIQPIDLTDGEKEKLESFMAKAFVTLSAEAKERYGFPHVLRLRNDYKLGRCNLRRSPDAKGVMEQLSLMEERIMSGYIKVGHALFTAFSTNGSERRPGVTDCDFIQEGAHAIFDAMYTYNGKNRFSTYVYYCVKNRLVSFSRKEEKSDGGEVSFKVKKIRAKVRELMQDYKIDLQTAIERVQSEDHLDEIVIANLKSSFARRRSEFNSESYSTRHNEEMELMLDVIETTELEPLERIIIEGKLRDGRSFIETYRNSPDGVNPATGKPFTRAWLGQVYLKACEKLQAVYNGESVSQTEAA
jgi:DNA-directed RNA polymerase specialized sigma subunit